MTATSPTEEASLRAHLSNQLTRKVARVIVDPEDRPSPISIKVTRTVRGPTRAPTKRQSSLIRGAPGASLRPKASHYPLSQPQERLPEYRRATLPPKVYAAVLRSALVRAKLAV